MLSIIKSKINLKQITSNPLIKNFFFLGTIQSFHLIIPLVLTPYLVKTLGISNFGKLIFCQSVINFLNILTDYGFSLSSSRSISVNRNDKHIVNVVYSETLAAKAVLLLITFLILVCLFPIPLFAENKTVLLFSFSICIGQIITPSWAFQGLEQMRTFAVINVAFKILYCLSVLLLIKHHADYINVNLFLGISGILAGICSMLLLYKRHGFLFVPVSFKQIKAAIKEGRYYFISSLSSNIFSYSNTVVLRIFTNYESVGLYGIIDKVVQLSKQIITIYMQVVHPSACFVAAKSFAEYKKFLKKVYIPFQFAYIFFCVGLFAFSTEIASFFNAVNIIQVSNFIHIIAFALIATSFNIPANLSLLALHLPKSYSFVYVIVSILSIVFNILFVMVLGLKGCIYNLLLTEILITVGLHCMLQFKHKEYALFNL